MRRGTGCAVHTVLPGALLRSKEKEMEKRTLGDGLEVAPIGFDCMG